MQMEYISSSTWRVSCSYDRLLNGLIDYTTWNDCEPWFDNDVVVLFKYMKENEPQPNTEVGNGTLPTEIWTWTLQNSEC